MRAWREGRLRVTVRLLFLLWVAQFCLLGVADTKQDFLCGLALSKYSKVETRSGGTMIRAFYYTVPEEAGSVKARIDADIRDYAEGRFPQGLPRLANFILTELLRNAANHGNHGDSNKVVHVAVQLSPKGITFYVTDEGKGFDPKDPEGAESYGISNKDGLELIHHYAKRVDYRRVRGRFQVAVVLSAKNF